MIVGIDLGTTNSAIGIFENNGARLIPNAFGVNLTPSIVGLSDGGTIIVGQPAKERLHTHPELTHSIFKRYMGTDRKFTLGKQAMRAEELSALVLKSLKQDAEKALGQTISKAVISVPAYFNNVQRDATKIAGQLAGFESIHLINEPTAAAIAYSLHDGDEERQFLIFDLGGGTFDVSIVDYFDGVMEVKGTTGDTFLGGEDFTQLIVDAMINRASNVLVQDPEPLRKQLSKALYPKAEALKLELGSKPIVTSSFKANDKDIDFSMTTEQFEAAATPLIDRIRKPVERVMRDAKLDYELLTSAILVGGATRMRMIHKIVAKMFGKLPHCNINPDEVVALGAATQAGLKSKDKALKDKVLTDVTPHTLGIGVVRDATSGDVNPRVFLPIIERNTTIPCSYVEHVHPVEPKQKIVVVDVYEGESRLIEGNVFLGRLEIPVEKRPATEENISVRFTFDVSGLLEVEATRHSDQKVFRKIIEKSPHTLRPEEVDAIFKKLENLKLHPYEDVVNLTVVHRANRVYEETLGELRQHVAQLLDAFMAVLETQDRDKIAKQRVLMERKLDMIEQELKI